MSEKTIILMEMTFNITYMIVIWALVLALFIKRDDVVKEKRPLGTLFLWAFFLLALGDTAHVGFRIFIRGLGYSDTLVIGNTSWNLIGYGVLFTSITISLFYAVLVMIWHERFKRPYTWFSYLLFAAAVARLLIFIPAANAWNSATLSWPWSLYRNIPLLVQGGVAFLFLRDALPKRDTPFIWIGVLILISYGFYIPVILFVHTHPSVGKFMMPKTTAYIVMAFVAYFTLHPRKR